VSTNNNRSDPDNNRYTIETSSHINYAAISSAQAREELKNPEEGCGLFSNGKVVHSFNQIDDNQFLNYLIGIALRLPIFIVIFIPTVMLELTRRGYYVGVKKKEEPTA